MADPRNILANEKKGTMLIDTNPRMLVVVFSNTKPNKYSRALANATLIPCHIEPVKEDPFRDVKITNGKLRVSLGTFMSTGSWFMSGRTFAFRCQQDCFRLIGYDEHVAQRNTAEKTTTSINHITKKIRTAFGNFESDREKSTWKSFRNAKLRCLDEIGDGLDFNPEN